MATKKTKSYNIMMIGLFSLMAVGSWIGFDIYRGLTNTTLTDVQQKQIAPLRVEADQELIDSLLKRKEFDDGYLSLVESRPVPLREGGSQTTINPEVTPEPEQVELVTEAAPEPEQVVEEPAVTESVSQDQATDSGSLEEGI